MKHCILYYNGKSIAPASKVVCWRHFAETAIKKSIQVKEQFEQEIVIRQRSIINILEVLFSRAGVFGSFDSSFVRESKPFPALKCMRGSRSAAASFKTHALSIIYPNSFPETRCIHLCLTYMNLNHANVRSYTQSSSHILWKTTLNDKTLIVWST